MKPVARAAGFFYIFTQHTKSKTMSYRDLNLKFYEALNDIFNINKQQTWEDLSKRITLDKISETYKIFASIFPYNLERYSLVPKNDPKEKLTALFHGKLDGQSIINNISRYSMYCDEIIVFHPLQNPHNTNPEFDPITKPHLWRYDFVNSLYFYIVLQKWVRAGLIHIIENPFQFDSEASSKLYAETENRVSKIEEELFNDPETIVEREKFMYDQLKASLLGMPLKAIENTAKGAFPNYTQSQIKQIALEIKQNEKKLPLYVDFGNVNPESLIVAKMGGSIEMIDAICHLTGSHSYTNEKMIKKQLELRGTNPFWTKFSILYSGVNLTYLDGVDTSFALKIREEERISGVRKSLRELSSFLEQTELNKVSDDKILQFNDKIISEIKKSEQEWIKIINDAKKANALLIGGSATIGAVLNPTKIIVPALGIPSSMIISEVFKLRGLKSYRSKDPYSVFVDLKNKKPSFSSNLKNCIF